MNNTMIKGITILEVLAHSDKALGVSELATRSGFGKSNVHRLLQALVEMGYVRRGGALGTYAASIKLWQLGSAVLQNADLRKIALPWMQRLLDQTRETVHLSVLDGMQVVYLEKLDSPEPVRAYSEVGGRAPAHAVATGKAMLAFQSEFELQKIAKNLTRQSPNTIVNHGRFIEEMHRVARMGYALNQGEWRESVGGIGAPIYDLEHRVTAAIGISGPIARLRSAGFAKLAKEVVIAAKGISESWDL